MSLLTTVFNLFKNQIGDPVNTAFIDNYNSNMDAIDLVLSEHQEELSDQSDRIDNIVGYEGTSSIEVVDARYSSEKDTTYSTLKSRLDGIDIETKIFRGNILNYMSIPGIIDTDIYDALVAAEADSNISAIYFPKGTCNLGTSITLTKKIIFEKDAIISVATGVVLTGNNAEIEAGMYQIFQLNGTATLTGTWNIKEVYPEWFGAGHNVDSAAAINNSFLLMSDLCRTLLLSDKTYIAEVSINFKDTNLRHVKCSKAIIKQKNNVNLNFIFGTSDDVTASISKFDIGCLSIDGNKANNLIALTNGLQLFGVEESNIDKCNVYDCNGNNYYVSGVSDHHSNTLYFNNCFARSAGVNNFYSTSYSEDIHLVTCDMGLAVSHCVVLGSPSSSIRTSTIWASLGQGVYLSAPSCQIFASSIEGHKLHGIYVSQYASFTSIMACKIYDNSNTEETYGDYSGIYVGGVSGSVAKGVNILGNSIYSGLYASTGLHKYSVFLDTYHSDCCIEGNGLDFVANGEKDPTKNPIFGLDSTDTLNGIRCTTDASKPDNAIAREKYYCTDTGEEISWNDVGSNWTTIPDKNQSGINFVGDGSSTETITLAASYPDSSSYSINITPTWQTEFWVSGVTSGGFTINFATPPSPGKNVYWQTSSNNFVVEGS